MAIAFVNLGASTFGTTVNPDISSGTDATSYANTSWTPPTADLILLAVFNTKATAADAVTSVTGNGITWTSIASATYGASNIKRLTLFGANGAGSSAGATTISFGANTQTACNASFFQATGVDLTGGVAAAFVQSPVVNAGAAATSGSITLAAAASVDNRPISVFGSAANETMTVRTNWTVMDIIGGTAPVRNCITQVRSDAFETTGSSTWVTSGVWGAIAAELKATAAATTSLPPQRRNQVTTLLQL